MRVRGRSIVRLPKEKLVDPTVSLHKFHFVDFMKRLRKHFPGIKIRDFHCGEYGELTGRPHHHACLFNLDFPDKKLYKQKDGIRLYTSETLEKLWGHGMCTVGDVTFESAAYVARYVMKKITGENAEAYYDGKQPEYCTQSRRPGIGQGWLEKYKDDLYPKDFVVIRGKKSKIPKYYNNKYELTNPDEYAEIKALRIRNQRGNPNNLPERVEASEVIKKAQIAFLKRTL